MDTHNLSLIITLLLIFVSAIFGGLVARYFKLPALLGYIASGVLFGNILSRSVDTLFLSQIADVGVTLLLFTIGVEFSFYRLRKAIHSVLWPALFQIFMTVCIVLLLCWLLQFGFMPSLYIGIAAGLSSTAIVVKVLSEKGELESVAGELSIGWLIMQDLAVIPIMILLPTLLKVQAVGTSSISSILGAIGISIAESIVAILAILFLGRLGVPRILDAMAKLKNREIFLLSVIGIVFLAALVTYAVGLSAALGAFIAGLLISETSQNHAIFAEVRPLRDLFAVVFFVSLGMVLPINQVFGMLPTILLLAAVILLLKWFLVFGLSRYLGNHRKTAFLVALSIAQMSEFGFIIAREGVILGVLTQERYIFLVALTFVTMFFGTTLFSQGNTVYYWFYKTLGRFIPNMFSSKLESKPNTEELQISNHIVICGYGRVGKYIGRALEMGKIPYLVIDYNQSTVAHLRAKSIPVVYGDPADKDVLDYAQVDYARSVVIAIPDRHTQELIISNAQTLNKHIRIICRTHHEEDQGYLKSLGVQTIVQPEFEAALSVISRLLPEYGLAPEDIAGKISRLKIEHGLG